MIIIKLFDRLYIMCIKYIYRLALSFIIVLCSAQSMMSQSDFPFNSVHGSTKEPLRIHVKNASNEKSYLSEHMPKGKIYLVSVWATWCGPCRGELNALQKVHCDWSGEYDFEFIAISVDTPTDHSKIFKMVNGVDWNFKVLHDEYGYLVKELGISAIPRMFLVDQEGNIVYEHRGFSSRELKRIEQKIESL